MYRERIGKISSDYIRSYNATHNTGIGCTLLERYCNICAGVCTPKSWKWLDECFLTTSHESGQRFHLFH